MSNINLGQDMQSLELGLRRETFTGVLLHAGQDAQGNTLDYLAGSDTGNLLEVTVPGGTLAMAQSVLDGLKMRGYKYQPFESAGTITDPAIEIGDGVTANGTKAIVMSQDVKHSRLMAPTLKAPFDEEVNHEFKYEPRSERNFRRESAYTRSRLSINAEAITAEVARASTAEGTLSGRLDVQATEITAKVSKSGGNQSSFGWTLFDDRWEVYSGGQTVLRATSGGVEVIGKITATSGYIGNTTSGFTIGSRSISNGMTELNDTDNDGVYVGTNGIALGAGKFKVTASGAVTASNVNITGGSISIRDANNNVAFQVTNTGALTATSGTFSGTVYAGKIEAGGDPGGPTTMGGGLITPHTIDYDPNNPSITPLSSNVYGGVGGGLNFMNMGPSGYTAPLVYGAIGSFTSSCNAPTGSFNTITDSNDESQTTDWKKTTVATAVSGSFNGNDWFWFTSTGGTDYILPTSFGASAWVSDTAEIKYLGY